MSLRKLINLHVVICTLTDCLIKSCDAVLRNALISSKLQHNPPPHPPTTAQAFEPLTTDLLKFPPLEAKMYSNTPPYCKGKISDRDFLKTGQALKLTPCGSFLLSQSHAKVNCLPSNTYIKRYNSCIPQERLDSSSLNFPLEPGKVQSPRPSPTPLQAQTTVK